MVLLDPALPLGLLGPHLDVPYGVILHGAEVTVPGRLPGSRAALARVLRGRAARRVGRPLPGRGGAARRARDRGIGWSRSRPGSTRVPSHHSRRPSAAPPGRRLGLPAQGPLVVSVSRLVPRKGMDVLIEAANRLASSYPDLVVAIGGDGRELARLQRLAAASPQRRARARAGERRGPRRPPRRGRRVRHGLPQPVARPGAGGLRHRVPRGGRRRLSPRSQGTAGERPRPCSTA